ncbi:MAG TPA: TolC family protein [Polyangia bacterium]
MNQICIVIFIMVKAATHSRFSGSIVGVVLVIVLTVPSRAFAKPVATGLSLAEARRLADTRAPEVVTARNRIREAEASRIGTGVRLPVNPRLSVDARPGLDREARGAWGWAGNLDLLFEVTGAAGARRGEAEARVGVARAEADVITLDAREEVSNAYLRVQLSRLRVEQARAAIGLAERLVEAAQHRSDAGAGTDIDLSAVRAELSERRAQLHEADAERIEDEMRLRLLLAIAPEQTLSLSSAADEVRSAPALAQVSAAARARRPDLIAVSERIRSLSAAEDRLRKEAHPKVGVFFGLDSSPMSPMFGIAGLSAELPIAQRNQGPRAVIASERRTEVDRYTLVERELELALRAAHGAHEARFAEFTVLTKEGIPAAEERLRLIETGWRAGRFDVFRLTAAAQDLARLRTLRLDVLARLWTNRFRLERLAGEW